MRTLSRFSANVTSVFRISSYLKHTCGMALVNATRYAEARLYLGLYEMSQLRSDRCGRS
jgi:hypothetical protein